MRNWSPTDVQAPVLRKRAHHELPRLLEPRRAEEIDLVAELFFLERQFTLQASGLKVDEEAIQATWIPGIDSLHRAFCGLSLCGNPAVRLHWSVEKAAKEPPAGSWTLIATALTQ